MLASLGCFNMTAWPPYTSHIAYELFRKKDVKRKKATYESKFWAVLKGKWPTSGGFTHIGKMPLNELTDNKKAQLDGYYVRIRYNDEVMQIPGCKAVGKHLEGDQSFCTLVSRTFGLIVSANMVGRFQRDCRQVYAQELARGM
jgi:acid phosphatase